MAAVEDDVTGSPRWRLGRPRVACTDDTGGGGGLGTGQSAAGGSGIDELSQPMIL